MTETGRRLLLCNCEETMAIDRQRLADAAGVEIPELYSHLCTRQVDAFKRAAGDGDGGPLLVGCTQEAPLFDELAAEAGDTAGERRYVNIRERAGWAEEGARAWPKMAALIAEAALPMVPTPALSLKSDGVTLVYGCDERAIAAAKRLKGRLNVTCLLTRADDILPPGVMDVPVFRGSVRTARGHMGAFTLTIDGFAPYRPSSRATLAFERGEDGAVSSCDLILDLSGGPPLFADRRDGYLRVEPGDAVGVERALFDAADLVGTFEKPRYVRVSPEICAHARSQIVGCTNCLDVCPSGAITPAGDHIAIDPFICMGHGLCASVCPTGAAAFDLPRGTALIERLRVLTATYARAGGRDAVLLVHDPAHGEEMIGILARSGPGLPAAALPFAVHEVTAVGLDVLLTALAYGVARIHLLARPDQRDVLDPLRRHAGLIETVVTGLGYRGGRVVIEAADDPLALAQSLATAVPPAIAGPARYLPTEDKRSLLTLALKHLHRQAPAPVETIALAPGAPFGRLLLDQGRCTLCLACVSACPVKALGDDPDRPKLTLIEGRCVQCGICRSTCPENAITLEPRLAFGDEARRAVVLKEEAPFRCVRCDKPFASETTITRLVERLTGHSMFATPERVELLKMCEDCRIQAQFAEKAPFAGPPPPKPVTTDDYLRRREEEKK